MSYELRDRELDGGRTMYKDPTIPEEVMNYVEPVDLDELFRGSDIGNTEPCFSGRDQASGRQDRSGKKQIW